MKEEKTYHFYGSCKTCLSKVPPVGHTYESDTCLLACPLLLKVLYYLHLHFSPKVLWLIVLFALEFKAQTVTWNPDVQLHLHSSRGKQESGKNVIEVDGCIWQQQ